MTKGQERELPANPGSSRADRAGASHPLVEHLEMLACPGCGGDLSEGDTERELVCTRCAHVFASEDGIPLLFWSHDAAPGDVTTTVQSFYEETPFPDYEDLDTIERLREKSERGVFAKLLSDSIPPSSRVLDAGCGTGQMPNYLGSTGARRVFGADMTLNSLKLGQQFKTRNNLRDTAFVQMNLMRPAFKPESFDLVISNGVLHHTSDPYGGFRSLARLVRPHGYILIGLYNRYGRLPTDLRRIFFRLTRGHLSALDPVVRRGGIGRRKQRAWMADQYMHPHESKHTYDEVLGWFDQAGFEFINAVPKATPRSPLRRHEPLFAHNRRGSRLDHLRVQASLLLHGGSEGGFFIMIGRKR